MIKITLSRLAIYLLVSPPSVISVPLIDDTFFESNSSIPTSSIIHGYVSDPNGRGTSSLIISCLLTLILCVWSALHLNVPHPSDTVPYKLRVNTRWIITGIYAPELVVFTSWRQWSSARILGRLVRETKANSIGNFALRHNAWTRTHDVFASTGGFAFEIDNHKEGVMALHHFLPKECPHRLTITARGMALLARCGRLPDVPKADILDKSKANDLAKALVILQASWMLIQVIGRLAAQLPVTLLEVNTIAHVLCAFLMYAMWWDKPLSPNEPFILREDWVPPLCAFMLMSSEMSGEVNKSGLESQTMIKTLFAFLHLYAKAPEIEAVRLVSLQTQCLPREETPTPNSDAKNREANHNNHPQPSIVSDEDKKAFHPLSEACTKELQKVKLGKAASTAFFERRPRVKGTALNQSQISAITLRRWDLAATAVEMYPVLREHQKLHQHEDSSCLHFKPEELLVTRVQNWPWDDLLRDVGGLVVGFVLWLANFAYGAIHTAAWNEHFPTDTEKWLWRSSALYIGFCGGLWIILNYFAQAYKPLNEFWENWMDGGGRKWQNFLIGIPVVVCGTSLLFARAFLVIEAFLSIRELPEAAYETPTWSQVFPHF